MKLKAFQAFKNNVLHQSLRSMNYCTAHKLNYQCYSASPGASWRVPVANRWPADLYPVNLVGVTTLRCANNVSGIRAQSIIKLEGYLNGLFDNRFCVGVFRIKDEVIFLWHNTRTDRQCERFAVDEEVGSELLSAC